MLVLERCQFLLQRQRALLHAFEEAAVIAARVGASKMGIWTRSAYAADGLDVLGYYHSHPDHPARPSQYDLDHAWPTFAYVIVAVAAGAAADMTAWCSR